MVLGLALTIRHTGWIYYQGGDQLWYYTSGWLLGHGSLPVPLVGYLMPALLAPVALIGGPDLVQSLPALVVFQVVFLLPVALLAFYGIANRIAGRLFAYGALLVWLAAPIVGIAYTNVGYHQRFTEEFLPQAFGLTGMADFPAMVLTLVSVYFCARVLFDEQPRLIDGVAAGVAAGAAIGVKPSAALFLVGAALAFAARRRIAHAGAVVAGMSPAIVTIALWKWRGFGHLPITSSYQPPHVAAAVPGLALHLHKYISFNWAHLGNNLTLLQEHFWSERVIEYLVFAGAIALARRSLTACLLIAGWFGAYVLVKGTYANAGIEDGSLLRLMIPSFPAFVLLVAALPFLLPRVARRARPRPARSLPEPRMRLALGVAVVVTAVIPFAAIAAASPLHGANPPAATVETTLIPFDVGLGLDARVHGGKVSLSWAPQRPAGGPVFFHVYRLPASATTYQCDNAPSEHCTLLARDLGVTSTAGSTDRPGKGAWTYRVGVAANWLANVTFGDVYLVSKAVTVTVP